MSGLQLLLAGIGALVIIALAVHGAWQARRAGPRRPAAREAPTAAALDSAGTGPGEERELPRREPVLDAAVGLDAHLQRQGPGMDGGLEPYLQRRSLPRLDPLIDAIAPIVVEAPVEGTVALAHMPTTRRVGSKPFFIEGCHLLTGAWETPQPGERYADLQAGVQLANRLGPINALEYSEFVQKVQAFADALGASPDIPDMAEVVARARELDAFASEHDAQLGVQLVARAVAWSPGYVQQQAARLGLVAGAVPGRLVLPATDEGGPPVLTLQFDASAAFAGDPNQAAVRELTLSFDVPQTASEQAPFALWRDAALALASEMDAVIVDDAGHPLQAASFDAIGGELDQLYEALASRDLSAGSAAARRLFS